MSVSAADSIARGFHLPQASRLAMRTLQRRDIYVTELRGGAGHGLTQPMPREDGYLVALQLVPCRDHDLFFEGRHVRPRNYEAGVASFYDLRREPIADLRDPFHSLMLQLPLVALDDIALEVGAPRIDGLQSEDGVSVADPVLHHLFSSLMPAVRRPQEATTLFVDHVAGAIATHVARVYGGMEFPSSRARGGLAPWQERRVKALVEENLEGDIALSVLAKECGMSVRHFGRAFRQSVGTPPHRWLLKRRVARAQDMLAHGKASIATIAAACGFADQSHLTRVFTANVGVSPAEWRRQGRDGP